MIRIGTPSDHTTEVNSDPSQTRLNVQACEERCWCQLCAPSEHLEIRHPEPVQESGRG